MEELRRSAGELLLDRYVFGTHQTAHEKELAFIDSRIAAAQNDKNYQEFVQVSKAVAEAEHQERITGRKHPELKVLKEKLKTFKDMFKESELLFWTARKSILSEPHVAPLLKALDKSFRRVNLEFLGEKDAQGKRLFLITDKLQSITHRVSQRGVDAQTWNRGLMAVPGTPALRPFFGTGAQMEVYNSEASDQVKAAIKKCKLFFDRTYLVDGIREAIDDYRTRHKTLGTPCLIGMKFIEGQPVAWLAGMHTLEGFKTAV